MSLKLNAVKGKVLIESKSTKGLEGIELELEILDLCNSVPWTRNSSDEFDSSL